MISYGKVRENSFRTENMFFRKGEENWQTGSQHTEGYISFPLDPEADKIEITDVAHALSLICRGNGHVKTFFSVGQHCIHCALEAEARGYGSRIALACLLHDASEAYMSDVPRPFKQHLSDYISHEKTLLDIVYTKYLGSRLDEEEEKKVKEIDDDMLYYDLKTF